MNLEIEQHGLNVVLDLPHRDKRTPFHLTVHQTLMREVDHSEWDALMSSEPVAVALKLSNWRGVLFELQRSWDYWREPENHTKLFCREGEPAPVFDLSPITFSLNGTVYDDPEKLPAPPDAACALGTFMLASPTLLVTDPCYNKGTWCTGELHARTGEWAAMVIKRDDYRGHRNAVLVIAHASVDIRRIVLDEMTDSGVHVGVDSGQAGFFERVRYPDDKAQFEYENGTWYKAICERTLDDNCGNATIAPGRFGAVSQTFWGDGGYPCLVQKDDAGLVVAAALIFDGSIRGDDHDEDEEPPTPSKDRPVIYVDSMVPADYSELDAMPSSVIAANDSVDVENDNIVIDTGRPNDDKA